MQLHQIIPQPVSQQGDLDSNQKLELLHLHKNPQERLQTKRRVQQKLQDFLLVNHQLVQKLILHQAMVVKHQVLVLVSHQ